MIILTFQTIKESIRGEVKRRMIFSVISNVLGIVAKMNIYSASLFSTKKVVEKRLMLLMVSKGL